MAALPEHLRAELGGCCPCRIASAKPVGQLDRFVQNAPPGALHAALLRAGPIRTRGSARRRWPAPSRGSYKPRRARAGRSRLTQAHPRALSVRKGRDGDSLGSPYVQQEVRKSSSPVKSRCVVPSGSGRFISRRLHPEKPSNLNPLGFLKFRVGASLEERGATSPTREGVGS